MWVVGLECDGCEETLACCKMLPRDRLAWVRANLEGHARSMGWEQAASPDDGEKWFCRRCRLAREGFPVGGPESLPHN